MAGWGGDRENKLHILDFTPPNKIMKLNHLASRAFSVYPDIYHSILEYQPVAAA